MPTRADDLTLPPEPYDVELFIGQTQVQATWNSPIEAEDTDYVGPPAWVFFADSPPRAPGGTTSIDYPAPGYGAWDFGDWEIIDGLDQTYSIIEANTDISARTDEEIDYFQVQLATDAHFNHVIRYDRMQKAHAKTWRVKKPGSARFYVRVRSVDALGNKSAWVSSNDYSKYPCQPFSPNIRFRNQHNDDLSLIVSYLSDQSLSPGADDSITRYEFGARESDYTTIAENLGAAEATVTVSEYDEDQVPTEFPFTAWIQDEQVTVTNIFGAQNLQWNITRGVNGTVAVAHTSGRRISYFGRGSQLMRQHIELDSDRFTEVVWRGIQPGTRWRAKVRAVDSQDRVSFWSNWTPVIRAAPGNSYDSEATPGGTGNCGSGATDSTETPPAPEDGGGPIVENPPPPITRDWPNERIVRFKTDTSTGSETATPATGYTAVATAARCTVEVAPTADATIDVNLNGISFLTLTIPADAIQSDLTWVTPPLEIGSQAGQGINPTDEISVAQTDMQDASGLLTLYLMIYLTA